MSLVIHRSDFQKLSQWQAFKRVPRSYLPMAWRDWLLDTGSLTQRLIKASGGDFKVELIAQGWMRPQRDEARILGLPLGQHALIREVALVCKGQIWVRARSVIPVQTLNGEERQLKSLGTKPLGSFLFSSRAMRRQALQLARFNDAVENTCYARRSVFLLHRKPLLVSEYFMPEILQHTD